MPLPSWPSAVRAPEVDRALDVVAAAVAAGDGRVLLDALAAKDRGTFDHAVRVTDLAVTVAAELGLDHDVLVEVGMCALLHDVGKVDVPDRILSSGRPLDAEDWSVMRGHAARSGELLSHSATLSVHAAGAAGHHERWDGGGYPQGLAGADIPLTARVVAVVDAVDAMTSSRAYRSADLEPAAVLAALDAGAGSQWDPAVVDAVAVVLRRRWSVD